MRVWAFVNYQPIKNRVTANIRMVPQKTHSSLFIASLPVLFDFIVDLGETSHMAYSCVIAFQVLTSEYVRRYPVIAVIRGRWGRF